MFFQCIQNSMSISIFKACVKGEIDFLFFGIFSKKGIVLSQFFYRCISNRTFAFFLKTESPVELWAEAAVCLAVLCDTIFPIEEPINAQAQKRRKILVNLEEKIRVEDMYLRCIESINLRTE